LKLFFDLGSELFPLFIKKEGEALLPRLMSLGSLMKPPIDLWQSGVDDALLDTVTIGPRDREHTHLPFAEQWNSRRVQVSVSHAGVATGPLDSHAGVLSGTYQPPTV
jgi:hypothetical protein